MRREFSAGGLVYKREDGKAVWLLRMPKANPGYRGKIGWNFPKGWLDDLEDGKEPGPLSRGEIKPTEEQLQTAAVREVKEEGGVEAEIKMKLSTVRLIYSEQTGERVMKFITYYVMEYKNNCPEGWGWETVEVKWVRAEEAEKLLIFKSDKELLREAGQAVE